MSFVPAELILKKKRGGALSTDELRFFVNSYVDGTIPDYQMSALLMAICFQSLTDEETFSLTDIMLKSGERFSFKDLGQPRVDKHSTGGVGDKTSLILAPLVASFGLKVPMIAGRGLGHTGGTLDKLEAIPGFRVSLSMKEFDHCIRKEGFAIMGQTPEICPADRMLYALRDVTGTVDSIPLICASIMSKKLAEDLSGLVLDVKFGAGAFMKNLDQAEMLAKNLMKIGKSQNVRVHSLLTSMEQPLGRFTGNSLEVFECLEIMKGKKFLENGVDFYQETKELTLWLAAHMLYLAELSSDLNSAYEMAEKNLENGKALEYFYKMCEFQGPSKPDEIPMTKNKIDLLAKEDGWLKSIQTEAYGVSSILLGAGRLKSTDKIDPKAGIELRVQVGQKIAKGQPLASLYCDDSKKLEVAKEKLSAAFEFASSPTTPAKLIAKTLTEENVS